MKEIEKIIRAYRQTDWANEKAALGTVVKVEESAYRRVGARLYVTSSGQWTGGISGGCLEGDALKRAQVAIFKNEASIVVYDTMDDDSHQIGVGLGCNGRIEVLLTPIQPGTNHNPLDHLAKITDSRQTELLIQILSNTASDTSLLGRFFSPDQLSSLATITNILESEITEKLEEVKSKEKSAVVRFDNESGETIELLIELIRPKVKLICVGDNYDVNAFVAVAHELGWETHLAGKLRKLNKQTVALAKSTRPYEQLDQLEVDAHTAVVLMSHDYKTDLQWIQHFAALPLPYIGLLGPKKRLEKMMRETDLPVQLDQLENLYSPVGLDIGAETPEEIALSIAAEIVAVLRERGGTNLRDRSGPIHERT